ncbi:cysteine and glycine-rich protein 2-like [Planoprotostelium fungivorum]|uniref:Cysteine and glycine-rich protein 2-like n=1 Tax=Planoprotostelium fungivorum TaxID=1890364 RepID=A0A2P6MZM1_9EUKA|nr:cysteine and glycine-rich protein 2-like [Planoprotostelium fungivorum]
MDQFCHILSPAFYRLPIMSKKCNTCGKAVYAMEEVKALGQSYHKPCLKCKTCAKNLRDGNWNDSGGQVYCNQCYEKNFVDDETKQLVADMENTYAKKVHGTGKAMPGLASGKPSPPIKSTSTAHRPAPPPPSAAAPTSPRKGLPTGLLSAINAQGGQRRSWAYGGWKMRPSTCILFCLLFIISAQAKLEVIDWFDASIYPWSSEGSETGTGTISLRQNAQEECNIELKAEFRHFSTNTFISSVFFTIGSNYTGNQVLLDGCGDENAAALKFTGASKIPKVKINDTCLNLPNVTIDALVGGFIGIGGISMCSNTPSIDHFLYYGVIPSYPGFLPKKVANAVCFPEHLDVDKPEIPNLPKQINVNFYEDSAAETPTVDTAAETPTVDTAPTVETTPTERKRDDHITCNCSISAIAGTDWSCSQEECMDFYPGDNRIITPTNSTYSRYSCVFTRTSFHVIDIADDHPAPSSSGEASPTTASSSSDGTSSVEATPSAPSTDETAAMTSNAQTSSVVNTSVEERETAINVTTTADAKGETTAAVPQPTDDQVAGSDKTVTSAAPTSTSEDARDDDPPSRNSLVVGIIFASLILSGMVILMIRKNKITSRSDGFKRMYGEF